MHHNHTTDWDAIIVGAGPAGAATAITLARSGARVLMLEKRTNLSASLGESLPPAAIGMVEHYLGPINDLLAQTPSIGLTKTSGNVSCWESDTPETSDFFFTAKGFGLCVERQRFDEALRQSACAAGVTLKYGVSVTACERTTDGSGWRIQVDEGSPEPPSMPTQSYYSSKFLVDCTGRRAAIAAMLGVQRSYDDSLFAFAQKFVSTSGADNDLYTRIEASQDGWWYSNRLPVPKAERDDDKTERLLVLHADKGSDVAKLAASTTGMMTLLGKQSTHLAEYLERYGYQPVGRVRGAAAGSERLHEFCGDGWLAVGDAAQAYDPLSSQGIFKALRSGNMAGQMIHYSLKNQASDNDKTAFFMKRYAQEQAQLWANYVEQRTHYYASQRRWAAQDFWSSRQQSTTHSVSNW